MRTCSMVEAYHSRGMVMRLWRQRSESPISDGEIRSLVQEILDELPTDVGRAVENVNVHLTDHPSAEMIRDHPNLDPRILGLYVGTPISRQSVFGSFYFPAQIFLFRANIYRYGRHRSNLRRDLRETLLHEIGHHLGLNEDDLRRLDL